MSLVRTVLASWPDAVGWLSVLEKNFEKSVKKRCEIFQVLAIPRRKKNINWNFQNRKNPRANRYQFTVCEIVVFFSLSNETSIKMAFYSLLLDRSRMVAEYEMADTMSWEIVLGPCLASQSLTTARYRIIHISINIHLLHSICLMRAAPLCLFVIREWVCL